ncbi:tryptophan--tRNA ligase [Candidatus Woesebacteria bacterium]|nr:MAG: tryptophan--tRNA ligase [Candidatus Woesebacteria bacterium]
MNKKRVLAGMRASGKLHLGNYYGGAKGMVALQEDENHETLYMVANLHGITTPFKSRELKESTKSVILDYLSVGLDPEKSTIFIQSDLADLHTQLAFYLSSFVTIARMQHLPTFKEKVKQYPESATMALLNYPVLMAADILIYKACEVPVGVDQEPHLEVAREIARKMNDQYGMDFPEPKRFTIKGGEYIPSLIGLGKMSKSVEGSYIALTDDLSTIKKRLAGIPTDSGKGEIKMEGEIKKYISEAGNESIGVSSLMKYVELFESEKCRAEYETQYQLSGIRYGDMKNKLADAIYKEILPVQEKRKELESKPRFIEEVTREGAKNARAIAETTIKEVKEKMGL